MRTGGGQSAVGEVEEEQLVILAPDKELTNSATERVTQMLGGTPAFAELQELWTCLNQHQVVLPKTQFSKIPSFLSLQSRRSLLVILLTAVGSGNIRGVTKILPFEHARFATSSAGSVMATNGNVFCSVGIN